MCEGFLEHAVSCIQTQDTIVWFNNQVNRSHVRNGLALTSRSN